MQPYLFPYLGYFQLVAAVDKFVFLDDVNFQKRGWINRNRFMLNGQVRYITVPLSDASQFAKINQVRIQKSDSWRWRTAECIRHSYSKAPNYGTIGQLLCEILFGDEAHISAMAIRSVATVSDYLGLGTKFVSSSSHHDSTDLHGTERVLDICRREAARHYYSLASGRKLYDPRVFELHDMSLRFVDPRLYPYRGSPEESHVGLSIVDVLMFCDKNAVREMLKTEVVH